MKEKAEGGDLEFGVVDLTGVGDEKSSLVDELALRAEIAVEVLESSHLHHVITGLRHDMHHIQSLQPSSSLFSHLVKHVRAISCSLGELEDVFEEELVLHDALHGLDEQIAEGHFMTQLLLRLGEELKERSERVRGGEVGGPARSRPGTRGSPTWACSGSTSHRECADDAPATAKGRRLNR